jgi:hypothetical protein
LACQIEINVSLEILASKSLKSYHRTGLCVRERNLRLANPDIENWRPETDQSKRRFGVDKSDFSAVETDESESKRRSCAAIFPERGNGLQRPHWLAGVRGFELSDAISESAVNPPPCHADAMQINSFCMADLSVCDLLRWDCEDLARPKRFELPTPRFLVLCRRPNGG